MGRTLLDHAVRERQGNRICPYLTYVFARWESYVPTRFVDNPKCPVLEAMSSERNLAHLEIFHVARIVSHFF